MLHSKQFLLNHSKHPPFEGWSTLRHTNHFLHFDPGLNVWQGHCSNGVPATLLGIAVETTSGTPSPEEAIQKIAAEDLPAAYSSWAGRWALLIGDEVHLDAAGTLGVFYTKSLDDVLVSSSVSILAELTGSLPSQNEIFHGLGVDWYPGPTTRAEGVLRLMPSQILHLTDLRVRPRSLLRKTDVRDPLAEFTQGLVTGIANLGKRYDKFYLPLTAGHDSRTVLAASIVAGIKPMAYTFDKPIITRADREMPPKLAAAAGLRHRLIPRGSFDRGRYSEFDLHSYGHCVDIDRKYFSYGQWQSWAQDGLILRGGGFGYGRAYYHKKLKLPDKFNINSPDATDRLCDAFGGKIAKRSQTRVREGLSLWLKWVSQNPEPGIDFQDRLFLEQRLGCWLSTIEQALDVTGTERLHIANSQRFYSLLNQPPLEERLRGSLQIQAIKQLAPHLAEFDINPPDPKWLQFRRRLLNYPLKISALLSGLGRQAA